MTLLWHGHKVSANLQAYMRERVKTACYMIEYTVKVSMKKGGRTESGFAELRPGTKTVMQDPGTKEKARTIGSFRSQPGEPPRVQTGRLRESITHRMEKVLPIGYVGTNEEYSKALEFGTSKMAPRPFMRPAIHKMMGYIRQMFSKDMQLGPPL